MVNVIQIGDFVERYGLRIAAGPAPKEERPFPMNQHRESPEVATAVVKYTAALAQMIRTGIAEAEADWPQLPGAE